MTLEWVKCWRSLRTSQIPSSGTRQICSRWATKAASTAQLSASSAIPGLARDVERVEQLPVDVDPQLFDGGVADPHGLRAFVARKPREFIFNQSALARDAVHRLDGVGRSGDGAQ